MNLKQYFSSYQELYGEYHFTSVSLLLETAEATDLSYLNVKYFRLTTGSCPDSGQTKTSQKGLIIESVERWEEMGEEKTR